MAKEWFISHKHLSGKNGERKSPGKLSEGKFGQLEAALGTLDELGEYLYPKLSENVKEDMSAQDIVDELKDIFGKYEKGTEKRAPGSVRIRQLNRVDAVIDALIKDSKKAAEVKLLWRNFH